MPIFIRSALRRGRWLAIAALLTGSLVYAEVLISSQYSLSAPVMANGGANTVSPNYKIRTGILGQAFSGVAQSANYNNSGGFVVPTAALPAADLSDAYVFPNPFKPNSPGRFQAAELTFGHLPAVATISVFAITGKQVAKLHKTDTTVDFYKWNVTNSDGQKLASGVYIYFMTAPGGGKARGKFAVIR